MSDGKAKAGIMGWPVGHSLSPRLHRYWLRKYGIDGGYEALAIEPETLGRALRGLPEQGFRGVNLTIPHKEKAVDFMDALEPAARRIGAVNTVVLREDGALEGRNTDAFGFTRNLLASGVDARIGPVAVLGAGGAARAVLVALQDLGVEEIRIVNRTREKAERLRDALGGGIDVFAWESSWRALDGAALLVNATSLGLQGQPPLDLALDGLPRHAAVADLVYAPLITGLLQRAQKRGHRIVDGLGMLLYQAQPAFEAFFGVEPEVTPELRAHMLEGR